MNNVSTGMQSNLVEGKVLHDVQLQVLRHLAMAIMKTMGPAGSNTLILKGMSSDMLIAEYTKDGNQLTKNIKYAGPLEMSIQTEIEQITRSIEKLVGDGTSTAVVMAYYIFDQILNSPDIDISKNPFEIIRRFKAAVEAVKKRIMKRKRECTLEDIGKISYISTNGNEELATEMQDIYRAYGMGVFIDVGTSVDENSYIRSHDGLVLDVGYSSNVYINTQTGVSHISKPRIYVFQDAIDTPEMCAMFETILNTNIIEHLNDRKYVPTVIVAPRISRDMSGLLRKLLGYLGQFPAEESTQKPPILVITNIDGISVNFMDHISQLCGCKMISKYIDPSIRKEHQEKGLAPTLDNICDEWYGEAEAVESDSTTSKFINPSKMFMLDDEGMIKVDENDEPVYSNEYNAIVDYISAEIKRLTETGEHSGAIGSLKEQLNAMKANMVEYLVGGLAVSDRNSAKDLVEDAVLNCRSAAKNGVGYGASFEGYLAAYTELSKNRDERLAPYFNIMVRAYEKFMKGLYSSAYESDQVNSIMNKISEDMKSCVNFGNTPEGPMNIVTGKYDGTVLTSIMTDGTVLDVISRIIMIMVTSNQAVLQAPNLNTYS